MNMKLTNCIVEHIFTNLGMIMPKQNSIFSSQLLIDQKLKFDENNQENQYPVYACEAEINQSKITIIASKLDNEDQSQDLFAIIELKNTPAYGCHLSLDGQEKYNEVSDGIINFQIKENMWLDTNVFIQASFLAGMEQLRDLTSSFTICAQPQDNFKKLSSFIKHCYEDNEGQKT